METETVRHRVKQKNVTYNSSMAHVYDFCLLFLSSALDVNKRAKSSLKAGTVSHLKLNSQHLAQSRYSINAY